MDAHNRVNAGMDLSSKCVGKTNFDSIFMGLGYFWYGLTWCTNFFVPFHEDFWILLELGKQGYF